MVGSDEVWNFRHPWYGGASIFFGDYCNADRLISYAASFGKDPQFYDFYRAMQSYQTTFLDEGDGKPAGNTTIVMSPGNEFLREFNGEQGR